MTRKTTSNVIGHFCAPMAIFLVPLSGVRNSLTDSGTTGWHESRNLGRSFTAMPSSPKGAQLMCPAYVLGSA